MEGPEAVDVDAMQAIIRVIGGPQIVVVRRGVWRHSARQVPVK